MLYLEKLTTLQMMSTVLTAKTQEPNREKADQGEGSQTTNIVVAVVVGVVVVLILIAIFIFIKRYEIKIVATLEFTSSNSCQTIKLVPL